ncbi:MAG: AbrB/MazE/SpoVT family DNA-binding domain-containing protein, partial [Candidatus Hodarchaeales archaeon]
MSSESTIDDKGRVRIPAALRKILNLKPGEKVIFTLEGTSLNMRSAVVPEDFNKQVKDYQAHLKAVTDKP